MLTFMPPTSILDKIMAKAQAGALAGAATHAAEVVSHGATFNGTKLAPSVGFALAVKPATKTLRDYQLAAVEAILVSRRVMLGLQPGMGKTAIIQAAIANSGERAVVVVPPTLRISPWAEDFAADYPHLKITMVTGRKAERIDPSADVAIVGDSVVAARREDIIRFGARFLAIDEAHRFRNYNAARTQAVLANFKKVNTTPGISDVLPADAYIVPATGTFGVNNAADVYSPLRITGAQQATAVSGSPTFPRFRQEWLTTESIWTGVKMIEKVTGCHNVQGLRNRLVNTCMVSVDRSVLNLPERTFAVRRLVLNGEAKTYKRMEDDFLTWVKENHGEKAAARAAKAEAITMLMKLWEQDGLAKVKATVEYVQDLLAQGEPVVLMGWHSSVLSALSEALSEAGARVGGIAGGMSAQAKADVVNAFQAGQLDVVIGQIEAAGVGLTLHRSCNIVFAQLPWSPGSFGQATDRIYRIGQKNACTVHVLNGQGMVSEHLWGVIQAKAAITDAINTGTPSTVDPDSVVDTVLSNYGW